jgi:hypothetical protein
MEKEVFGIILGIFLLISVSAYQISSDDLEYGDVDPELVQAYLAENTISNSFLCEMLKETQSSKIIGQQIPDKVPFKNEIINVYIEEEIFGYVILNNSYVDEFDCSENNESTYDILIEDYNTIGDFENSEDPINLMQEKLDSGEIEIISHGFVKKVKLGLMKLGLKVAGWFMS